MSFGFSIGDFLALIEVAGKVRQKWTDAPVEYELLQIEVGNLQRLLKTLSELVNQIQISAQQKQDFEDASAHCTSILRKADELANKYSSLQNSQKTLKNRARRTWKRFKASPEDVRHLRLQLVAVVGQFGVFQNNMEIAMTQEMSRKVDDFYMSDQRQRKAEMADWFASSNFANQHSDCLARRHVGTAVWFLHSQEYVSWRQGGNQVLFCPGIPGSGKTIMAATVIHDLRQHFGQQHEVTVVYFYCNFRRGSEQDLYHVLACLVRQLFQEQNIVPKPVSDLYNTHNDRKTKPSVDELKSLLRCLVQCYKKVFLIIDALDECSNDERSRDKLLDELFHLQIQSNSDVNLLTTSRSIPEVANRFQNTPVLEIEAKQDDIEKYVDDRMPELCSAVKKSKTLQRDIKAGITATVGGMFLLAQLYFESLKGKMTPKAVQEVLRNMSNGPEALNIAYEASMVRVNQQQEGYRHLAQQMLSWIVFAREELSLQALREAVIIEPGIEFIDHDNDLIDSDEMLSVCGGLVTIDRKSQVVRLVHYTTHEFLQRMKDKWLPNGEDLLAQGCVNYLCMSALAPITKLDPVLPKVIELHPSFQAYKLLPYVSINWGFHVSTLENTENYTRALLFDGDKLKLTSLLTFCYIKFYQYVAPEETSGLHICALFNNVKAACYLLDTGVNVNQIDSSEETPLTFATRHGSIDITKLLLARPEIDVNQGKPLNSAIYHGHQEIVELVLAHPSVDVNQGLPLDSAIHAGDEKVLERLLAHPGIDINKGEPLLRACEGGHVAMVKLLLAQPGINLNSGFPLYQAVSQGHTAIVQLLLVQPGIDVINGAPLYRAVYEKHEDIVKLLVAYPEVDVNRGQPLSYAAHKGSEEIVRLLLARPDIDVNKAEPLYWATCEGHKEIVILLLAHPDIDVNRKDPLYWAVHNGHKSIVELLLAEPGIVINDGGEKLRDTAARRGHSEIAALLSTQLGSPI